MQFNPPSDVKRIMPPSRGEVLILRSKVEGHHVMVLAVPTPYDPISLYAFVTNDTAYLQSEHFDSHTNNHYVEVARGKLQDMEVILHA